jgi:predicted amidohydrolase YtcJ
MVGLALAAAWGRATVAAEQPADTAYRNGRVYTVDANDSVQQALAVRGGWIVYVGDEAGLAPFVGATTEVVDLAGRTLMPGLVDAHMHPLEGGLKVLACSLNYEALTVAEFRRRIQECLDSTRDKEPDGWLEVVNWFQQNMLPPGTELTHADLDVLSTRRPILVRSSFGHSTLANARAMELARTTADTPDPEAGKIQHGSDGRPTGIFEDSAQALFEPLLPKTTHAEVVAGAAASLDAIRRQGITTFLDASEEGVPADEVVAAYAQLQREGKLTARAHFAIRIEPEEGRDPDRAVATLLGIAHRHDQGPIGPRPTITVRNAKLFMDGVITAPAFTGVMLEPYLVNEGTTEEPEWVPSDNRGPAPYFPAPVLKPLLMKLAAAGIDPHIHADGDGATRYALDGYEAMRARYPGEKIRAAIAHAEIVDPVDFPRFGKLDVIPVPSFQWAKRASDTIEGAEPYLGPVRFRYMEPEGFLHEAGARIAYGSDWPVDPLAEWFGIEVGVTRTNDPSAGPHYAGRLSEDPGLSLATAIRAITMNACYALHQEKETGSLEVGKLADLIVLDRDPFAIPPAEIGEVRVLLTVVGGEVVYRAEGFAP